MHHLPKHSEPLKGAVHDILQETKESDCSNQEASQKEEARACDNKRHGMVWVTCIMACASTTALGSPEIVTAPAARP